MLAAVVNSIPPRRPFPCFTAILDRGRRARLALPCLRRFAIFSTKQNMIYYALGVAAVVFFFIIRKRIADVPGPPSDSEWDAQSEDNLSRALNDRFTRF